MARTLRTLVLFDIDWTLLNFPSDRAVLRGVIETLTDDPALRALDPTGRSDGWVVARLADAFGETPEELLPRYAATYRRHLAAAAAREPIEALPGAELLLTRLAGEGELKLRAARLDRHFRPLRGGFGDDADDRRDIVAAALRVCADARAERAVLVGDTDLDMSSAAAHDVRPIGVATGRHSETELREGGAAATFASLEATDAVLDAIFGGSDR
jgi:phosphoglycolate phosphatase-like HAD superfamily hydrolase